MLRKVGVSMTSSMPSLLAAICALGLVFDPVMSITGRDENVSLMSTESTVDQTELFFNYIKCVVHLYILMNACVFDN